MTAQAQVQLLDFHQKPALRMPWSQIWPGMLLFLLIGAAAILMETPYRAGQAYQAYPIGIILFLGGYLVILVGLLWGWLNGFPRWTFPYLGYSLIFSWYMSYMASPGLMLFNTPVFGRQLWGWRAWVPLGVVALLVLILSKSATQPVMNLLKNAWMDWTQLAFFLYSLLPLSVLILLDEMDKSYSFPASVIAVIFILLGAFLYLKYPDWRKGFLPLVFCAFLAILTLGFGSQLYWQTHYVNFTTQEYRLLPGPVPWRTILSKSILPAVVFTLVLLVPGLLGIARWLVQLVISRKSQSST